MDLVYGHLAMKQVTVHAAKTHLSRLLREVAAGQEVVITRAGDREAESLAEAVHSAQRDVERVEGVRVTRNSTLDRRRLEDVPTIDP